MLATRISTVLRKTAPESWKFVIIQVTSGGHAVFDRQICCLVELSIFDVRLFNDTSEHLLLWQLDLTDALQIDKVN